MANGRITLCTKVRCLKAIVDALKQLGGPHGVSGRHDMRTKSRTAVFVVATILTCATLVTGLIVALTVQRRLVARELSEARFVDMVAQEVDLNSGLTLEPSDVGVFLVLNHTYEPVNFVDQGFGVQYFAIEAASGDWRVLDTRTQPGTQPKTLPPKLEGFDLAHLNLWQVPVDELSAMGFNNVRVYVGGVGALTGKRYGAYFDMKVEP